MAMTDIQIQTSLTNWFSENYAGEVDWGGLDQFDPEGDDLQSWVHFHVDRITDRKQRKGGKKVCDIRIVVQCWSRDIADDLGEKDMYGAARKASIIKDLLKHKEIPIKDFEDTTEPTVGNCRLMEPKTTDETDRTEDENSGYSMYMVLVDGFVQEI